VEQGRHCPENQKGTGSAVLYRQLFSMLCTKIFIFKYLYYMYYMCMSMKTNFL
jgi:hypothetical protein